MYHSEIEIISKLGGKLVASSISDILVEISSKEASIRASLCKEGKKFLSKYKSNNNMTTDSFPFLKLEGKIHKLSVEDLKNKSINKLTFCPVCDSKLFITKPLATALMKLLREFNYLSLTAMNAQNILPKSGWDVSKQFSNIYPFSSSPYYLCYTCDLSDAYSNCTLEDINNAVKKLSPLISKSVSFLEN